MIARALLTLAAATVTPAHAACPQSLAVYTEAGGGAMIEFRPASEPSAISNEFRLVPENGPVLDGLVYWTERGFVQPIGVIQKDCPDGDATGEELEACSPWQNLVYAVAADGKVFEIPHQDDNAAYSLLFADLARALRQSDLNFGDAQWPGNDQFMLSGCQE